MRRGSVELEIISCACINGSKFSACKMRDESIYIYIYTYIYMLIVSETIAINGMMVAFNIIPFFFYF